MDGHVDATRARMRMRLYPMIQQGYVHCNGSNDIALAKEKIMRGPAPFRFPFFRGRRWMILLAQYKAEDDDEVLFIRCDKISKTQ